MEDYDYKRFRGNVNAAPASVKHLEVREDMVEIKDSLRCTDKLQPPGVGKARTASEIRYGVVPSRGTWTGESSALSLQPQANPRVSPQSLEYDTSHPNMTSLPPPPPPQWTDPVDLGLNSFWSHSSEPSGPADRSAQSSRTQANGSSSADTQRDGRPRTAEDRSDMLQSFKVSLGDPCSKVLPAALKKYRITDDWRMYALFVCYGTTERCLGLDEKVLLLFKKLRDAGKNPVFMLRHVRDIRAPISVAQEKQAKKKGKNESTAAETSSTAGNGPGHTDAVIFWTGVSYAIAIYPYGADYDDEYDVTVGAMFVVLRRSEGWSEVQRDPTGSGTVDEHARRCWVPRGCLLETSMPPATAISEALTVASAQPPSPSPQNLASPVGGKPMSDAPILPSSIISTNYLAVALMDWQPQGDYELDLVKDDLLRVFKRYHHWSYMAKESGRRGWAPSWLIGKASSGSANPPNPGTGLSSNYDSNADDPKDLGADLSQSNVLASVSSYAPQPPPMSPAFSSQVVKESGRRGWLPSWLIRKASSGSTNPPAPGTGLSSNYDSNADEKEGLGAVLSQSNLLANFSISKKRRGFVRLQ